MPKALTPSHTPRHALTMQCACLVMARAPIAGACKTRLARDVGDWQAALLCEAMLLDTLRALDQLSVTRRIVAVAPEHHGPRIVKQIVPSHWTVIRQQGATLGDRIMHALASLGSDEGVMITGTDCPILPIADMNRVLAGWSTPAGGSPVVLGPSEDGGYYLIGMRQPEDSIFANIDWGTQRVAAQTRERAIGVGLAILELPSSFDVDVLKDLEKLAKILDRQPHLAPRTAQAIVRLRS